MYLAEPTLAKVFSHFLSSFWVKENQDLLIKCISKDLGFSGGKPVSACLIYKCLIQWRSFEVERTNIFDRIIQTVGSALEVWLSFCLVGMVPVWVSSYIIYVCAKGQSDWLFSIESVSINELIL